MANKPAGLNTHAPGPYSGEGLYEWLRHREPRWASLAIIHRLDKDTSGVIAFSKTTLANRSLTAQFAQRAVHKQYLLLTDRRPNKVSFTARSNLKRLGDKYFSAGPGTGGEPAETRFRLLPDGADGRLLLQAEPLTGRTHQIRVHAADNGFPVLGDELYGGRPAPRVCLHAAELCFRHPATGAPVRFAAPADFDADPRLALRQALIDRDLTNAFRIVHGASDGWPGWHLDILGEWMLSQSEQELAVPQLAEVQRLAKKFGCRGCYHKRLLRRPGQIAAAESRSRLAWGREAPDNFEILENGMRYELSFGEGYSVGLFLDQRDNRCRLLAGHVAAGFPLYGGEPGPDEDEAAPAEGATEKPADYSVLNTFGYTCAFSVCAARGGARTTSLDLSRKYLEWGRRNFALNGIDLARHDFIYGDVFDWLRRLAKKDRRFDVVLLDPPTFSNSKKHGVFRAEKDYGALVLAALPLVKVGGVLLASTNAAGWAPEQFLAVARHAIQQAGRNLERQHYAPQPPDFPVSRAEPAYLKTVWLKLG